MDLIHKYFLETEIKVGLTLAVIIILHLARIFVIRTASNKVAPLRRRYAIRQVISYISLFVGMVTISLIWFEQLKSVVTLLSFVAAAIIIASKELILNLVSNFIIILRGLFEVGDRVKIGEFSGDVIETGPFFFTLAEVGGNSIGDDHTGKTIKIPNGMVLTWPLINFTRSKSLIWNEIIVELDVLSDYKKALNICRQIVVADAYKISETEMLSIRDHGEDIMFIDSAPRAAAEIKDGKLIISMRFLCKFHKSRTLELKIWEEILTEFKEHDDIILYRK